jgi:tight adherence protein B
VVEAVPGGRLIFAVLVPVAAAAVGLGLAGMVGAVVGSIYGAGVVRLGGRAIRRRRDEAAAAVVRAAISCLADDLAAGSSASGALARACEAAALGVERIAVFGLIPPAVNMRTAARLRSVTVQGSVGGEVADALSTVDDPALAALMERLAQAWRIAEISGAPVRLTVERLAEDELSRARADARRHARASGARTTALLLGCLPVVGIGMAAAIGVDPVEVLTHTPAGAGCAVLAAALQVAGTEWTDRLVSGDRGRRRP